MSAHVISLRPQSQPRIDPTDLVLGTLVELDAVGTPLVSFPGSESLQLIPAQSCPPVSGGDCGRTVALLFVSGDLNRPMIVGFVRSLDTESRRGCAGKPGPMTITADSSVEHTVQPQTAHSTVTADQETVSDRLVFQADREIILRCGEASLTLTREGKVLVKGAYISTHATGTQRIKGAVIQIN